jgi:hypothetical protein
MTRNIKVLGLAFVAVAAMSMVAAGGAQAAQLHAATVGANVYLTAEQYAGGQAHVFRLTPPTGPTTTCTQVHFDAVGLQKEADPVPKTTQHFTLTPQYTGCTGFGQPAAVQMNGCKWTLTGTGQAANTWAVDVVGCTAGKQIVDSTGGFCEIKTPEQSTIGGHITFAQTGTDITGQITLTGIKYQVAGPLCGHTNNVTTSDGEYQGSVTARAFEDAGDTQKEHNGHKATLRARGAGPVTLTTT